MAYPTRFLTYYKKRNDIASFIVPELTNMIGYTDLN